MGAKKERADLDRETLRFIRYKAWELAQNSAFNPDDQEDIEQELTLDLLTRLTNFNPERSPRRAFVLMVVANKAASLLEHRLADKRNPDCEAFSLNEVVKDVEDGETGKGELVGADQLDDPALYRYGPSETQVDLQIDLARAVYSLDHSQGALLRELQTKTVTELAQELGVARGTVYGWISKIGRAFRDAGLGEYL
jgi:DNA-directed RNA polymerase specialized sigma24 family protein